MQPESDGRPFAVVTGASRGIGAEYARALAARGYDLLLASRSGKELAELAAELTGRYSVQAAVAPLDLAKPEAAHELYAAAREQRPAVDMLVNNAGFGLYGRFADMPLPRMREMLQLNLATLTDSIRLFLPGMVERGRGTIINVASIVGLFPVPYLAEYAATKAYVVSLSEALSEEVRGTGVHIQTCCPGSTETSFHEVAGHMPKDPVRSDTPAEVVGVSLAALHKGPSLVTMGMRGRLMAMLSRIMPRRTLLRASASFLRPRSKADSKPEP